MMAVGSLTLVSMAWSIQALTISRGLSGSSLRLRLSEEYSRRIFSKCRSCDIVKKSEEKSAGLSLATLALELAELSFEGCYALILCVDSLLVGV